MLEKNIFCIILPVLHFSSHSFAWSSEPTCSCLSLEEENDLDIQMWIALLPAGGPSIQCEGSLWGIFCMAISSRDVNHASLLTAKYQLNDHCGKRTSVYFGAQRKYLVSTAILLPSLFMETLESCVYN